jgi:Protein of unknown function (DUF3071)
VPPGGLDHPVTGGYCTIIIIRRTAVSTGEYPADQCWARRGDERERASQFGCYFRDMPRKVLATEGSASQTRVLGKNSPTVTGSQEGTEREDSAKGTLMQELRLVAVSEDGSYAVLVVPGRSGRFALPIDERLRTVARGQFSRLAQYEIEVESPLRPKEIQDRIRAGETAEEIADAAGLPVDRVRRFEGPVLAEREFRAKEAQQATVRSRESGPGPRLGEIVAERLSEAGANSEEVDWDSRKRQDGNWQVQLAYTVAGRMYMAEWIYDPRSKHVTPNDDEAIRLCLSEAEWPGPRQPARVGQTATVTPIGSRVGAVAGHPADPKAFAERSVNQAIVHPSRLGPPGVAAVGAGMLARDDRATVGHADGPGPVSAKPAGSEPTAAKAAEAKPAAAESQPARPGRRSAGGRPRRSSVPSWDEIMLGNSRQPD